MKTKLLQLSQKIREPAINQSIIVSFSTGINSLLGLAFYFLVIRNLTVSDFGNFSFLLAIGVLAGELGDIGLSSAIVKFGHGPDFQKIVTLAFYQRIFIGMGIILLALFAEISFGLDFIVSAAIALSGLFFSVVTQSFLAKEKYFFSTGLNILCNIFRLLIVVGLVYFGILSTNLTLWAYAASYGLTFLIAFLLLVKILGFSPIKFREARKFLQTIIPFTSWIGGSQAVAALSAKIDNPMIYAFAGPMQTGLYSGAQKITSIISQFAGVLDSVFAPKFAKNENKSHLKTYIVLASVVSTLIILTIPLASWFVALVFPKSYGGSIPVLQVLLIGFAIFFISTPFASSTVYKFGKSQIHLTANLLQLLLTLILYFFLLPKYGAMGAAMTFVIVNFISLVFFVSAHTILKKNNV